MKLHTSDFKNKISTFGRELNSKISYTLDGVDYELSNEQLNSLTPHFESYILKSAMKGLEIDSNVEIPKETIVHFEFGVKVREEEDFVDENDDGYDYINFGDYIVKDVEKQEDTLSYKITCYDFMLNAMKDYTSLLVNYPITIRDFIIALSDRIGLTFKNSTDEFPNYDKEIDHELYIDSDGNSLGYTYRDILDELSAVTASTICIDIETNELELRYINDTEDVIDEEFLRDVNVNFGKKFGPVNCIVLSRSADSDSVFLDDETSVQANGRCEIQIKDNQIMNFNDRADYLPDILEELNGFEYFINDFSSIGICYYDICDKYQIQIGNILYDCIMFNDDISITQGLKEEIYTDMPEDTNLDYQKMDKDDRAISQVYIIADKANKRIESVVSDVTQAKNDASNALSKTATLETSVTTIQTNTYTKTEINEKLTDGSVTQLKSTLVTVDNNGTTWDKNDSNVKTNVDADGLEIIDKTGASNETLLEAKYDSVLGETIVRAKRIKVEKYLTVGTHSRFEDYEDGTGCFYLE